MNGKAGAFFTAAAFPGKFRSPPAGPRRAPKDVPGTWRLRDGRSVVFRGIRPGDETLMAKFHGALSDDTVYFRYLHPVKLSRRIDPGRLSRICRPDAATERVLVAEHRDPRTGEASLGAVGRLEKWPGANRAEFAVVVSDPFQRQGLGTELVRRLLAVARAERLASVQAEIHPDNAAMRGLCRALGFRLVQRDPSLRAEIVP